MTYTIAVCTVKLPDDGQRICPKHVEFYSKSKFEKLMNLGKNGYNMYRGWTQTTKTSTTI